MKAKDVINLVVTVALIGMAVGIAYMTNMPYQNGWGVAYIPWTVLSVLWGFHLNECYHN